MNMFKEECFISPRSHHTGLLWALEGLAWDPEYFNSTAIILSKLASLDPGGHLANRPLNSLENIFKPWHYQTFASFKQRMEALEIILKNEFKIGWKLLIKMLPDQRSIAEPTNKMRWRLFDESYNIKYTLEERLKTHEKLVDLIVRYYDYSESRLPKLLEKTASKELNPKLRQKILSFLINNHTKINQEKYSGWHELRKILSNHRSFSDSDWALPESELQIFEKLYTLLEPTDFIDETLWIFNNHLPDFPEGIDRDNLSYDKQQKIAKNKRYEALEKIYNDFGIEKIKSLVKEVKEPWILGDVLAYLLEDKNEIISLCDFLTKEGKELTFIQSFLSRKVAEEGLEWIFNIYHKIKELGFDNEQIALMFIDLHQSPELWDFIDGTNEVIKNKYWSTINPRFWNLDIQHKLRGINELIEVERFISVVSLCYQKFEDIPVNKLIEVLKKAGTRASEDIKNLDGYHVEKILENLENREDIDQDKLIELEWLYIPILTSYGAKHSPILLHNELASDPKFFIEALSYLYFSDKDDTSKEESDKQQKVRAKNIYNLLNTWDNIPGVNIDGEIDEEYLWSWIEEVRELADKVGRLQVADIHIGQILAQYPENSVDSWPPTEICEVIDTINTKNLKSGFHTAVFNKKGVTTRGAFDGGKIEREYAKYYQEQSDKIKHEYPVTAKILDNLASNYKKEAQAMDEQAERDKLDY